MPDDIPLPSPDVCVRSARVLLTGDQLLIRTALGKLLAAHDLVVASECTNDPAAIRSLAQHVDVVILDVDLETGGGMPPERIASLMDAAQKVPVLIVTHGDDRRTISVALQHGASGVVLKSGSPAVLMRAIRVVLAGGMWLERAIDGSLPDDEAAVACDIGPEDFTPASGRS